MDFGAHLREARERAGLSLRDLSIATKISVVMLEALEGNDHSRLPGGIFRRAFIRNYAKQVGLDPEETLQTFLSHYPDEAVAAAQVHVVEDEGGFESQRQVASTALSFGVVSALILALFFFATRGAERRASRVESAPQPSASAPADTVPEPAGTVGMEETGPTPAAVPSAPATAGPLTLTLQPVGPCWVTVSVGGHESLGRLLQAGERVEQTTSEEIGLLLGDAGTCAFSINDVPARALGRPGEVVQIRINPSNYRNFLSQ
jgi:cytoskeletal protein RodZ